MKTLEKKLLSNRISRRTFIKGAAALGASLSPTGVLAKKTIEDKAYGWTGNLLKIDLSSNGVSRSGTRDYTQDFVGGRALGSRIYYDEVTPNVDALDPDNVLIMTSGPLGGTNVAACSRWVLTAKSPQLYPDQYGFGNGGGFMGSTIKKAGYDGLMVRGKAKGPSYLLIENEKAELKDAKGLWGLTSDDTMKKLKGIHGADASVVCIGPAGEKQIRFAIALTDQGGSLSNGMGAVMGSKNLKAIVVKGSKTITVAYPDKITELNRTSSFLRKGLNESLFKRDIMLDGIEKLKPSPCYACPEGCARATYRHISGQTGVRKNCGSAYFYMPWDQMYNKGKATNTPFLATQLCNRFGLCTQEVSHLIDWLYKCFNGGILSEDQTGLPLSKIGSLEFIESLADMITNKKGFGELLAQGTRRASIEQGKEAEKVALTRITPTGYINNSYGPRIFLTTALFYATEPRYPIIQLHEVNYVLFKWTLWHISAGKMSPITTDDIRKIAARVWGSEKAVDFSTYDGKAKAAVIIQNREHAKETMVACDWYYPINDTDQKEDHMGDPTLVPQFFHAVTGKNMSEDSYLKLGERSFNLQRIIQGREGRSGRKEDTVNELNFTEPVEKSEAVFGMFNPEFKLPGSGNEIVSRKGKTLDRKEFEKMKDEYYQLRGWDVATGLQTRKILEELGLGRLCSEMEKRGFLKG
jgi:aldehyde:ferredoxin oxidoreductase